MTTTEPIEHEPIERSPTPALRWSQRWLVSQRYDLLFFIASCSLTLVFLVLFKLLVHWQFLFRFDAILITYFIFTAFLDHPHIFQTFSRTHFDPIEFKKHRWMHTVGLLGLIAIGLVLTGLGKEAEMIVAASILGSYHIIRQHYGFLKAYKNLNRDRHPTDDWIDFGLFNTGMFACFFNDYADAGHQVTIYGNLVSDYPQIPPVFLHVTASAFFVFLILFVVRQIDHIRHQRALNLPKILLLTAALSTHYLVYFVAGVPFLVAEALETAYHDVQYQGWMRHYQTQRFPKIKHMASKWLAIAMIYGVVVGIIEILSLSDRQWAVWAFAPFSMLVIYHYLVDGIVWKFSHQPELRVLFSRPAAPAPESP